jgi:hypothetical protein
MRKKGILAASLLRCVCHGRALDAPRMPKSRPQTCLLRLPNTASSGPGLRRNPSPSLLPLGPAATPRGKRSFGIDAPPAARRHQPLFARRPRGETQKGLTNTGACLWAGYRIGRYEAGLSRPWHDSGLPFWKGQLRRLRFRVSGVARLELGPL